MGITIPARNAIMRFVVYSELLTVKYLTQDNARTTKRIVQTSLLPIMRIERQILKKSKLPIVPTTTEIVNSAGKLKECAMYVVAPYSEIRLEHTTAPTIALKSRLILRRYVATNVNKSAGDATERRRQLVSILRMSGYRSSCNTTIHAFGVGDANRTLCSLATTSYLSHRAEPIGLTTYNRYAAHAIARKTIQLMTIALIGYPNRLNILSTNVLVRSPYNLESEPSRLNC